MKCILVILNIRVGYMFANMELYKIFYYVTRSGSISKATEQLYISQPAVSRAIKNLEHAIGCKLFDRSSKGIKLTLEGDILFTHLEKAFNNINAAEYKINEIQNMQHGEVKIGVSDTLCQHYLLPFLQKYNHQYPQIKIYVTDPSSLQIVNLVKKGSIDFGIVNLPIEDNELKIVKSYDLQDCFVVG